MDTSWKRDEARLDLASVLIRDLHRITDVEPEFSLGPIIDLTTRGVVLVGAFPRDAEGLVKAIPMMLILLVQRRIPKRAEGQRHEVPTSECSSDEVTDGH